MKEVLGISLGDSDRKLDVTVELLGEVVHMRREGTDGDLERYVQLLHASDGKVDAIGLGGVDLWLWCGQRRYTWREPKRLLRHVKQTPVLDGSGLKNTLERATIRYLQERGLVDFRHSRTLLVCGVDRFGMAEADWEQGGAVMYGDLMFGLGIPAPIRSLRALRTVARLALPVAVQLPVRWIYPVGKKQKSIVPRFGKAYAWADVICGDNHYIRRHVPEDLGGKVIVTNTTTAEDAALYGARKVRLLVTTTPSLGGRSPGTNIYEAAIAAALGRNPTTLTVEDYEEALQRTGWEPTVSDLTAAG